jgi:hypothetical protein
MFLNLAGTCAAATAAADSTLTYVIRIATHACAIAVSACKQQKLRLPRERSTHARIISITGGNVPAVRHLHRLPCVLHVSAVVHLVQVQRHVQVNAVALRVAGGGQGLVCACACAARHAGEGGSSLQ